MRKKTSTQAEERHHTILVVDDTPENLMLISDLLKNLYIVKVANNGKTALKIAESTTPPDLILLDIMMPDIDGYQVCEMLQKSPKTSQIPVIFLTAKSEAEDEAKGFDLGALDYITKPIVPQVLLARVKAQLHIKDTADFLKDKSAFLENEVSRRTSEIEAVQDVTIVAMACLAETRDNETANHIRRTQHYVKALAEKLRDHPKFSRFLTKKNIQLLFKSAPLHDIGKIGIPDKILLKQGRFEPNEFEIMKTHTTLGKEAIERAEKQLGKSVDFLKFAKEIAYSHQERWDGSGYPEGLVGEQIPISARLMAVADMYDALISKRVNREGVPHAKAVEFIKAGSGQNFDPDVVNAFVEISEQFREIAQTYGDSDRDIKQQAERLNLVMSG